MCLQEKIHIHIKKQPPALIFFKTRISMPVRLSIKRRENLPNYKLSPPS